MHLITTKIKFRDIKNKLKDSSQNIEILFDKVNSLIEKYNNLKSENLDIKNKMNLLKNQNEKLVEDLRNSKLNYQSLKIGKFLESDGKQYVKKKN